MRSHVKSGTSDYPGMLGKLYAALEVWGKDDPRYIEYKRILLAEEDSDPAIPPETIFMREQGIKAMNEQLYNKFVKGKKECGKTLSDDTTECYAEFLQRDLHGDWSNEFEVPKDDPTRRDNQSHHELWDSINSDSAYHHLYTNNDEGFTMKPCTLADPPIRCEDEEPWDSPRADSAADTSKKKKKQKVESKLTDIWDEVGVKY
jgi:hypothetical protein